MANTKKDRKRIWYKDNGTPTLYRDDFARQGFQLSLLGATSKEIAEFFDVAIGTIENWKRVHPEFSYALRRGGMVADMAVTKSIYKRACGYNYEEETLVEGKDAKGEHYAYTRKVKKHVAGDVKAGIFWLTNRQKEKWANVTKIEAVADQKFDIEDALKMKTLTPMQVELLKQIAVKQIAASSGISEN